MKFSNKTIIIILSSLMAILLLTSCSNGKGSESQSSSQSQTTAQTASKAGINADSLGIQKPQSCGIKPIISGTGFRVYGSGSVKANQKEFLAEIDVKDLDKIKVGDKVTADNIQKKVMCAGIVKSLPDKNSVTGKDSCEIDVLLSGDNSKSKTTPSPKVSSSSNNQSSSSVTTSASSSSVGNGLPAVDADVEVSIQLPGEKGVIYLSNGAIFKGNDHKKYVWVSDEEYTKVNPDNFHLKPVTTGETDGKITKITSGLKEGEFVLIGY